MRPSDTEPPAAGSISRSSWAGMASMGDSGREAIAGFEGTQGLSWHFRRVVIFFMEASPGGRGFG